MGMLHVRGRGLYLNLPTQTSAMAYENRRCMLRDGLSSLALLSMTDIDATDSGVVIDLRWLGGSCFAIWRLLPLQTHRHGLLQLRDQR